MEHAQKWLKAAAYLVMGFGLVFALGAHPATDVVPLFFLDLILWPLDGADMETTASMRLLSALSGGVMFGWGVTLWYVAGPVLEANAGLAKRILTAGVVSWFVLDSVGSVIAGAPLNLLGNLVFLLAFMVPLRGLGRTATQPA